MKHLNEFFSIVLCGHKFLFWGISGTGTEAEIRYESDERDDGKGGGLDFDCEHDISFLKLGLGV